MAEKPVLTGIVLAGGMSTRMGRDKASLPWGKSDLLHSVLEELEAVCSQLIVVSNVPRTILLPDVIIIGDQYRGCGPLGGIHAGLKVSGSEYNFVMACDMPYVSSQAVAWMAGAAQGYDAAVPFIDGHYHPLCAVYHRRCLPYIDAMLAGGCYRIFDFYPKISLRLISADELAPFDRDSNMLRNLNSPSDL